MARPLIGADFSALGDKELVRRFEMLRGNMQKKYGRKALRAGAKVVQKTAKQRVPVRTGRLKKGLKVRALKRSRKHFGVGVVTPPRASLGLWSDGGYYPAHLAWGWKATKRRAKAQPRPSVKLATQKKARSDGMGRRGRRYLKRSAMQVKQQVFTRVETVLWQEINKDLAGKGGR